MKGKVLLSCLIAVCLLVGTVSADTVILFADYEAAVAETTDNTWITIRNDVGDWYDDTYSNYLNEGYTVATSTNGVFSSNYRGLRKFVWNESMPSGSTINSATLYVYGYGKFDALGTVNFSVIDYTGGIPVVNGDYDSTTFRRQANDIAYADFAVDGWNSILLTNLTYINNTGGNTTYMIVHSADADASALVWAAGGISGFRLRAISVQCPYMTIDYTPAAGGDPPVASFDKNQTAGTAPLPVGFTDTSTNTPDAWNWSLRNVTGNNTEIWWSTDQNPSIALGAGNWSFALNASNAYGYNITPGPAWVNVSASAPAPDILILIINYIRQFFYLPMRLI